MIGRKFKDRYLIETHLGDGSTATVYRARDTRLGREVALKILLPHVRDNARERFLQEATAAAQLNHPNIMAIYDMEADDGQDFLVAEYVAGAPLSAYIPAPPDVVIALGVQIAQALQYAHERHIIHRDIKPANIQVKADGQIKIMDLGLALPPEAKRVTTAGMVIGTPAYLSPEQAQGHTLDHRTDIYSLGVVLYEMATGQLPFDADNITALLLQQVGQPAPSPRLTNPELPAALEAVILKALEKNPVRRFQSCGALAVTLQAALAPVDSGRSTAILDHLAAAPQRARRPSRRLILADDHTVIRRALVSMLEQHDEFTVIAEATDGEVALTQTLNLLPDVLLLDLDMPRKGGLDILPVVRARAPNVKVLVLTGRDEDWYIVQALRAGAHGYLLKSADESELLQGIRNVMNGQLVLGQGVAERIVGGLIDKGEAAGELTEAERRVLLYVAAGYENEAIGDRLQIALTEVIELLAQAMNRLRAQDRHAAALKALKQGDISLDDLHDL